MLVSFFLISAKLLKKMLDKAFKFRITGTTNGIRKFADI